MLASLNQFGLFHSIPQSFIQNSLEILARIIKSLNIRLPNIYNLIRYTHESGPNRILLLEVLFNLSRVGILLENTL